MLYRNASSAVELVFQRVLFNNTSDTKIDCRLMIVNAVKYMAWF